MIKAAQVGVGWKIWVEVGGTTLSAERTKLGLGKGAVQVVARPGRGARLSRKAQRAAPKLTGG